MTKTKTTAPVKPMSKTDAFKQRVDEVTFDVLVDAGTTGATSEELVAAFMAHGLFARESQAVLNVGHSIHRLRMQLGTDLPIHDRVGSHGGKGVYRFPINAKDAEQWLRGLGAQVVKRMENLDHYLDVMTVRFPRKAERDRFQLAQANLQAAVIAVRQGLSVVDDEREHEREIERAVKAATRTTTPRRQAS